MDMACYSNKGSAPLCGVCILRDGCSNLIDAAQLQQHGLKLRSSSSCVPVRFVTIDISDVSSARAACI